MPFHMFELMWSLPTIIWLFALIHCLVNKHLSGGAKVGWALLVFFLSWVGAVVYLINWYGFARKKHQIIPQFQPSYTPYYQPPQQRSMPYESGYQSSQQSYTPYDSSYGYTPYEQGYQPVKTVKPRPFIADVAEPQEHISSVHEQPLYEQPQVMYPEDPR